TVLFGLEAEAQTNSYTFTNVVDNTQHKFLDNPWGMSRPTSPALRETEWWVSDAGTGYSTLYYADKLGAASLAPLVVKIPAAHARGTGSPTGTAYYAGTGPGPGSHNFAF